MGSAVGLDRHRAQELLVLRRQLRRERATLLAAGEEDAGVGPAAEDLLHRLAGGVGGGERGLDRRQELLHQGVHVALSRHGGPYDTIRPASVRRAAAGE